MILRYRLLVFLSLISLGNLIYAQETISQDVKVVRAYTPTLSDAYKVNLMPEMRDTSSFRPQFNYHILSKSMAVDYIVEPIAPAKLGKDRKEQLTNSYVKGGLGNYTTVFGELEYNILQSEPYLLRLNLGHLTSLGELKLEDDSKVEAPFHDTWAGINFKHFFDDKTLSVDLCFLHNIYKYYGYQTLNPEQDYFLPEAGSSIKGETLIPEDRQRLSSVRFNIGLENSEEANSEVQYATSLNFLSFGNYTGVKQNGFGLKGRVNGHVNDLNLFADASVNYYGTSVPDSDAPMYHFSKRNNTLITVSPGIRFQFDNAHVNVGVLLAGEFDTDDEYFRVAPNITGELNVVEGIVSIFGGITGKVNQNDYASVQYENPFVSADQNVKSSFYGINVQAGIKGNFSSATSFSADVAYSFFEDEHFFVNKMYAQSTGIGPHDVGDVINYSNLFVAQHDDGKLLQVRGEMLFHPGKNIEIVARGTYSGWNLDSLKHAWHKPEVELNLNGRFMPMENLYVDAGISFLGKRFAFVPEETNEKKLDPVVDLNIGAEYRYSSKWTFFAQLNNIAASKYYKWNGYPMQGINVRAGVGFSF
ncbi:TonB-dependent receptor [Marinilabiliaceae bacterium JC017]|nr:TonB-dependent receptor [Marinilabiliaceae bacterium JC017]